MKFTNKKISIGLSIAITFIIASMAYSIGYKFAMDKFNSIISYNNEKQQLYHRLSEIDTSIRREYVGNIDEFDLITGICSGYINGMSDSRCKYLTRQEYEEYLNLNIQYPLIKSDILHGSIGYIKIFSITEEFGVSVMNSIDSLHTKNDISSFILDLRNVQNGEIEYVQDLLDYALDDGSIISIVPKNQNDKKQIHTIKHKDIDILSFSCYVLVNENTAGISELVAYVLKNMNNSKLIGNATAGKIYKTKVINFQSDDHVLIFPAFKFMLNETPLNEKINVDINIDLNNSQKDLLMDNQLPYDQDDQLQVALKKI
jgi:C-terminal processing protease CtpA/Prc